MATFPSLVPITLSQSVHYMGFISVNGEMYRICIQMRQGQKSLRGAVLKCEWKLRELLKPHLTLLQQLLQHSTSVEKYVLELKNILEHQSKASKKPSLPPPVVYYQTIIKEIESIGWNRLVFIDEAFQLLRLQVTDAGGRTHLLSIRLSSKHPDESPDCACDIPVPFDPVWTHQEGLKSVVDQFEQQLSQFQQLWDMLDELDKATWILEPDNPSRAACTRRIALGQMASLQIKVNPEHPSAVPEIQFLGADHVVNPLKKALNENIHVWNPDMSLFKNLQSVLEIEFPSPATSNKQDFSVECGICYSYRLEEELPDQVCDDARCGQPFHQSCLYEWLRALPSSRQSFNTVFGECPYCSQPITVKMPTK